MILSDVAHLSIYFYTKPVGHTSFGCVPRSLAKSRLVRHNQRIPGVLIALIVIRTLLRFAYTKCIIIWRTVVFGPGKSDSVELTARVRTVFGCQTCPTPVCILSIPQIRRACHGSHTFSRTFGRKCFRQPVQYGRSGEIRLLAAAQLGL